MDNILKTGDATMIFNGGKTLEGCPESYEQAEDEVEAYDVAKDNERDIGAAPCSLHPVVDKEVISPKRVCDVASRRGFTYNQVINFVAPLPPDLMDEDLKMQEIIRKKPS